jgi:dimethylamine/trimethylamine dehydrogenase
MLATRYRPVGWTSPTSANFAAGTGRRLRAKKAGFDIVYVYAAHNLTSAAALSVAPLQSPHRRVRRLAREPRQAVPRGDRGHQGRRRRHLCGLAVRFAVDELIGEDGLTHQGEGHDVIAMLAELPDLWDVNISPWSNDSQTARFSEEGFQEPYISFVKKLTTKPVVGVGRYTSPDAMVRVIRQGIMDFIGSARPSIADPFLPKQDRGGPQRRHPRVHRLQHLYHRRLPHGAGALHAEPTMGEEWRRGWHPERIAPVKAPESALIVGGGPAGSGSSPRPRRARC